jgi:hypothetical protein
VAPLAKHGKVQRLSGISKHIQMGLHRPTSMEFFDTSGLHIFFFVFVVVFVFGLWTWQTSHGNILHKQCECFVLYRKPFTLNSDLASVAYDQHAMTVARVCMPPSWKLARYFRFIGLNPLNEAIHNLSV